MSYVLNLNNRQLSSEEVICEVQGKPELAPFVGDVLLQWLGETNSELLVFTIEFTEALLKKCFVMYLIIGTNKFMDKISKLTENTDIHVRTKALDFIQFFGKRFQYRGDLFFSSTLANLKAKNVEFPPPRDDPWKPHAHDTWCSDWNIKNTKILVEEGVSPNIYDDYFWTAVPSVFAYELFHQEELITLLINYGADPSIGIFSDHNQHSSWCKAANAGASFYYPILMKHWHWWEVSPCEYAANNNLEKVQEYCHSPQKKEHEIGCILFSAIAANAIEVVCWMVQNYPDLLIKEHYSLTPFLVAASNGRLEVVELLLQYGHVIKETDHTEGLSIAAENGHLNVVQWLFKNNKPSYELSTPLTRAIKGGHIEIVQWLVQNGSDIQERDEDGWSAMMYAMFFGHLHMAKWIFNNGGKDMVLEPDDNGKTPILLACEGGWMDVAKWLFENGAQATDVDKSGNTTVLRAASKGNFELTKLLYEKGAKLTGKNENNETPLSEAAASGNLELVIWLFENGEKVDLKLPLHKAAKNGHFKIVEYLSERGVKQFSLLGASCNGSMKIVKFLYEKGAKVMETSTEKYENERSSIHFAAERGNLQLLKFLIKRGAYIHHRDKHLRTPFLHAAMSGLVEPLKLLLKLRASIDDKDSKGKTALSLAAEEGHWTAFKFLIEQGAKIEDKCLFYAVCGRNINVIRFLLDNGVKVGEELDEEGNNILMHAAEQGNLEIFRIILETGIKVDVPNKAGKTPLLVASCNGRLEIVKLLHQCKADLLSTDNRNSTPLIMACEGGHLPVVKYLLDERATLSEVDDSGITPLFKAAQYGHLQVIKYLIEKGAKVTDTIGDTTALYHAISMIYRASYHKEQIAVIQYLIDHGSPVEGKHLIREAVHIDNLNLFKQLVEKSPPLTKEDYTDLLNAAAYNGSLRIAQWLEENGASLGSGEFYESPLVAAARGYGGLPVMKWLFQKLGLNTCITHVNNRGNTALLTAALSGNYRTVQFLIENGVPWSQKNHDGDTVLTLTNNHELVRWILNNCPITEADIENDLNRTKVDTVKKILKFHQEWPRIRLLFIGQKDSGSIFSIISADVVGFIALQFRLMWKM